MQYFVSKIITVLCHRIGEKVQYFYAFEGKYKLINIYFKPFVVILTHANRGNVAVICWNTLNSKKWGVTGEEYDGVTLGDNEEVKTLLAINFSEFTVEKTEGDYKAGSLKETEDDVIVKSTPERNAEIGDRQIVLGLNNSSTEDGFTTVYEAFDFAKEPKKSVKETKTYKDGDDVVAYVPENVWADLNTLKNHKVTVVFGEENKVALIVVSDESITDSYVTAWDKDEAEIEIDGTTYEVNKDAEVSLYGYVLTHDKFESEREDYTAVRAIDDIFNTLGIATPKKVVNRTISASVILDDDGDIEKIDFMIAQNCGTNTVKTADEKVLIGMQEGIVKSISSKGVVKGYEGLTSMFSGRKLEDVADEDEPRVIKDGKIASLEDIEEGDVVTAIFTKETSGSSAEYKLVYVCSERVTGSISKVKNEAITVDGTSYNTVIGFIVDKNGDIEDADVPEDMNWKELYDEEVELYLNHMGEVVAIVASTDATDLTVGILTRDASEKDDNDKDVTYLSVKILTKDGTKKTYKVYNDDKDEDVTLSASAYKAGAAVLFSADANGIIDEDEIFVIGEGEYVADKVIKDLDGKDLTIKEVTKYSEYDDKKINDAYRYTTSTVGFNTKVNDAEIISKGWSALVSKTGTNATITGGAYALVDTKTNRVVYYIANVYKYAGTSDNYALLVDIELTKDSDDDKVYIATLFENGKEVSYEIDEGELTATLSTVSSIIENKNVVASEKDFVKYELSNDKITSIETIVNVDDIKDLADEAPLNTLIKDIVSAAVKASLEVRTVVDDDIFFTDNAKDASGSKVAELAELVIDEDGCIIYDLRDGEYEMFTGERSELEGLLVYGFAADCDARYVDTLVILD